MQQAAQSVKTLDAQLKQADAEFKATGDKEKYMADKAKLLEDKLKAQKNAAKNAQQALKQMQSQGVDPLSQAYQKMQQQLAQAETGVLETSAAINTLGQSEQDAARGADQLTASVQGISKKISLQQVISGINTITGGLENAAKKAVELGKALWDEVISQAEKADNIATNAMIYGLTSEEYQRMQKVADTIGETSVEAIVNAQSRLNYGLGKDSAKTIEALRAIGVATKELKDTGGGILEYVDKDAVDIFWEAGEAMMKLGDVTEQQAAAQDIFGRGWKELRPLFNMGREAYEEALSEQNVLSDEGIQKLAELHDAYVKYQGDIETLEQKIMTGMAPALTAGTEALDGLLTRLLQYLDTPEGQAMLDRLEESITGLFEDLANIDPEDVVNNFVNVFDTLIQSFEWVTQNWSDVESGLKAIVGVWAGGKAVSGALTIIQMLNGLKGLTGGGSGGGAGILGSAGTSTLTGILTTALKASLPVLGTITVATLAIAAGTVLLGASLNSSKTLKEAAEKGAQQNAELNEFNEKIASRSTNSELKEAHQTLSDWIVPQHGTTGLEELPSMQEFARRYIDFMRNFADDATMDAVSDIVYEKGEEFAEDFLKSMEAVLLNENDYTGASQQKIVDMVDEIMYAVRERMAQEVVFIKVQPILDAGSSARTLGASGIAGLLRNVIGNANGLPFVPFDGYPTVLHKGERVLTAQANKNYTYNNHNYFGSVNLNNGTQVDQLADAIARQTRKQSAGYGG